MLGSIKLAVKMSGIMVPEIEANTYRDQECHRNDVIPDLNIFL